VDAFEANAAIAQWPWPRIDSAGSVCVARGHVVLRRRDGQTIVEAPTSDVFAEMSSLLISLSIWIQGGRYFLQAPMARWFLPTWRPVQHAKRTFALARQFLEAFEEQGGHRGKPTR
jgi:hypothetical protein